VKLLREELSASLSRQELEAMNQRFQREVQTTATLSSPHTIEIFDFGQRRDGSLYYVMEMLHGLDVETLVKTYGPQPAERVVHLLRQACASLAEAHYRNLIHRDIKPANIYVCSVGMEVDFVKVLDFGLVRDLNTEHRLTIQGSTPGTPAYLAPEFALDKIDHRADLYALGCVAYYLLTGGLVFEAQSRVAMMAAHSQQQPVAPSKRTELPIPAALDEIVLALLAKNPAERPQTATELARAPRRRAARDAVDAGNARRAGGELTCPRSSRRAATETLRRHGSAPEHSRLVEWLTAISCAERPG
jgi:serine/threonine-protein kinase